MATISFPTPVVTISTDADGTTHIDTTAASVSLSAVEALVLANFILAAQPVTAVPVEVPSTDVVVEPAAPIN